MIAKSMILRSCVALITITLFILLQNPNIAHAQTLGILSLGSGYTCSNSIIYNSKSKSIKFSTAKKDVDKQLARLKGKKGKSVNKKVNALKALRSSLTDCNKGKFNVSVTIAASGLSDGKLARNNTANFTAATEGTASDLRFRWSLLAGRGELSDGTNKLSSPTVAGRVISSVGKITGEEQISVDVIDSKNRRLATASLSFTIVPFIDSTVKRRGCFDQPKILATNGSAFFVVNEDGSGQQWLGGVSGLSADISPDGEWIAWIDDDGSRYDLTVQRCTGTEKRKVLGGIGQDYEPIFSPDSKTVYFLRPDPSQSDPPRPPRAPHNPLFATDVAAYNIETGQLRFLTQFRATGNRVGQLTVSPVTGDIAFFLQRSDFSTGLFFLRPENGSIREFLTALPVGRYNMGMHWSPDGRDIIYSGITPQGGGIFRINVSDGSSPNLLLSGITAGHVSGAHYYAGGTRIVFEASFKVWSMDANGNDFKQLGTLSAFGVNGVLR